MNPIRLVSGAVTLPAHAAAAVIGTSVGVAATGARTTARVVGRVIERVSGSGRVPSAPWPDERPPAAEVDPEPRARRTTTTPSSAVPAPSVADPSGSAGSAPGAGSAKMVPTTRSAAPMAPAPEAPARKAAARKAPSKQAAVLAPALGLSEAEVEAGLEGEITTPSGIPAAGPGVNPDTTDTDLHQPGTEPLMDPATVKAVTSESDMLRRAADIDKG